MHEFALGVAGQLHRLLVDLIRPEQLDALFPNLNGLAHGDPHIGIKEVAALYALLHIVRDGDGSAGLFGDFLAFSDEFLAGLQAFGSHNAHIHAHLGTTDHQRVAHVVTGIAEVSVGDLVEGFVNMLAHREEVSQHLGRVELVGKAVPDGHAGELGEFFHRGLLEAAVFDTVEHASEHAGRVGHGLLNADLGTAGSKISHMRALVVGGHLEGTTGAGGGLLENQGNVLALQARLLRAGILGAFEVACEVQHVLNFPGSEV